ncbi:MAG: acetyl-CoA carboxylase biotin carboxyl carrier protein subunit [Flavobacteriaceae bacterium]|nr:acetyl-CoA carboxylase biotin carboxyl carrier protein subunit [Flavobacteriaceae bacterium]
MEKKYRLTVNNSIKQKIDPSLSQELSLTQNKENRFHLLHGNKTYHAELLKRDFHKKEYDILLNGNTYIVKIETPLDLVIEKMGFSHGSSKKINFITAPMPGIIIDMKVKVGDEVKEGETLFILEAMKMENAITAPKSGTVKVIEAVKGDTVEKGKLIIELN